MLDPDALAAIGLVCLAAILYCALCLDRVPRRPLSRLHRRHP